MFTCLRRYHHILIVVAQRERKAYYMDGMKGKSRMRVKVISDLLDCGLFEFTCKEGCVTSKEKKKFEHVTDFGCVQRSADLPDIFHHC